MKYIELIAKLSFLLTVLFFFLSKSEKSRIKQVIFYFASYIILHEVIYTYLKYRYPEIGFLFNLIYIPVEFIFLSYFFRISFLKHLNIKILRIITIAFITFWVVSSLVLKQASFDSIVNTVESLIILFYCILYFNEQIKLPQSVFIYTQPSFWITCGIFLFTSGTFFVFVYRQTSWHIEEFIFQYAYIHAISFILKNVLFSIAMFINPSKTPYTDNSVTLV